jgi:NAD(P)-dependent dehydrogenase (short-subunit alcohol dehydrogenase family)
VLDAGITSRRRQWDIAEDVGRRFRQRLGETGAARAALHFLHLAAVSLPAHLTISHTCLLQPTEESPHERRNSVQALGGIDILVSNAGRQQAHDSILDISTEQFDWTMKTNIYAPFWIIKAALPHLQPGSSIIATASEQAYDPSPELYDYAQTKAATMNFVKSLARQLGPKGIRVNGVAPGPVWTALQISGGASLEKQKKFGSQTPLGRPGMPAELGGIYVLLADNQGSFANGQIYGSSGGSGQP